MHSTGLVQVLDRQICKFTMTSNCKLVALGLGDEKSKMKADKYQG